MTRGGKRPGAGRPSQGLIRLHIHVTEEQAQWLRGTDNASETIRQLIADAMKKDEIPDSYEGLTSFNRR